MTHSSPRRRTCLAAATLLALLLPAVAMAETRRLTILAGGDVTLGHHLPEFFEELRARGATETDRLAYPFLHLAGTTRNADIFWVNLEGALTRHLEAIPKRFNFRADPADISILEAAGVDLVTLANNHAMDFGSSGLAETMSTLAAAGIEHTGAGADLAAARRSLVLERNGIRAGFLAYLFLGPETSEPAMMYAGSNSAGVAGTGDLMQLLTWVSEDIAHLRDRADVVLVSFHWGTEGVLQAGPEQQRLARAAARAGADVVLGHHPHNVQGRQSLGSTAVAYSLGNLMFAGNWSPRRKEGALLNIEVLLELPGGATQVSACFLPLSVDQLPGFPFQPHFLQPDAAAAVRRLMDCSGRPETCAPGQP